MEVMMKLEPEHGITPNSWVVVEITHKDQKYKKIVSGWSGGYLDGDSWRLSSDIKNVDKAHSEFYAVVETMSGSVYNLYYQANELRMSNSGIYNQLKEQFGDSVEIVEL
jgi:hypothetical protein